VSDARGLFIAGTDTGIGKTRAAVCIVRALVRKGLRVAVMKPVAAGAVATPDGLRNGDATALIAAANVSAEYALVNPYCLRAPISPHLAAEEEGVAIDAAHITHAFEALARRADCVVVEGAGGWLAPIGAGETMADVARVLKLPILLVVGLKLGCLNHAQLTMRAIAADRLRLGGWVANHLDASFERVPENLATLERLLRQPALAFIAHQLTEETPAADLSHVGPAAPELPEHAANALLALLTER
jgi:dethiobiotin synthetase